MNAQSRFPTGKRITFTGRLASMSRVAAMRFVVVNGGTVRNRVSKRTDVLVIGADGWPLRKSGAITRNLSRAGKLIEGGGKIAIIGEAEFLRRSFEDAEESSICRQHTLEQLSRLLGVSGLRLRRWMRQGLICSSDTGAVTPTFDFQAVAAARTIAGLVARGVSTKELTNSLRQLQRLLPDDTTLKSCIIALERRLLVRHGEQLIDPQGQLYFSFESLGSTPPIVEERSNRSAATEPIDSRQKHLEAFATLDPDEWFDRAYQLQSDGYLHEAAAYYREWLERFGNDHEVLFNYANIYMTQGKIDDAIELFRQCVQIQPTYASAWNNLGLCKYKRGDLIGGIEAMRHAAELLPRHVPTLFNLADMLDEAGAESEASELWLRIASQRSSESDEQLKAYASERVGLALPLSS